MKKLIALVMSLAMCAAVVPAQALEYGAEWQNYSSDNAQVYSDVPASHWAYNAIGKVKAANWFSGYPDGTFRPNESITREEAMTVLVKYLGLQLKETTASSYYDVDSSRWSSPYIEAGKLLFPERETFDGQKPFQPEMPILREEVMYAMVIAKKYNNEVEFADQSILNMFSDSNSISEKLKGYVSTAVRVGLVSGHPNGTIGAQDPLTRAEFATMLYRAQGIGDGTGGGLSAVPTVESVTLSLQLVTEMTVGDTVTILATANMSDGTTSDYSSNLSPYNSSNNNVVLTNRNQISAVNAGTAVIKFNNDTLLADKELVINVSAPTQTPVPTAEPTAEPQEEEDSRNTADADADDEPETGAALTGTKWSVDSLSLNAGESARIKLIGVYSDGSEKDIFDEYNLYSYDEDIAEIDSDGNVTAVSAGSTKIGYSADGVASVGAARPLSVTVAAAENGEIVAMEWSVDEVSLSVGESAMVKLLGVFEDGSTVDITEECGLYTDDESIAVFENGKVKAVAAGDTDLWFDSMPKAGLVMPRLLAIHVE